jgi:GxxExxY protein
MDIEEVARQIVDAAVKVHRTLGPGLLESAYQQCLAYELRRRGVQAECEVLLPIVYDGQQIDAGYRIDMLIENCIIIENKTVEKLLPIHQAQLLTYLKLRNCQLGFLLNWNVVLMKHGIKRMVNNLNRQVTKAKLNR